MRLCILFAAMMMGFVRGGCQGCSGRPKPPQENHLYYERSVMDMQDRRIERLDQRISEQREVLDHHSLGLLRMQEDIDKTQSREQQKIMAIIDLQKRVDTIEETIKPMSPAED